jgi:hypothetical protein
VFVLALGRNEEHVQSKGICRDRGLLPTLGNTRSSPDMSETDKISVFAQNIPIDMDRDDVWELVLDLLLNRFLGFRRSIESISTSLRGGEKGLAAMARYLRAFVGQYKIDGGPLKGRVL